MEPQDDPRFLKGIEEFNQQLFFECHETLEELWLEERGEDRKFYRQGDNEVVSLAGVSLDIPAGAFAVIMGPSGSGKSTLLHLIGGLDRPTSGDLLVDGRLIGQMVDEEITLFRRTHIGFVF